MRQAKTIIDGLKYRIPYLRETLLPKRDWSGQPVPNPQYGNILRSTQVNTDPVDAPNPLPAIVTFSPGWPTVGPMDPTCGAVAEAVDCHTATVCAGSVNAVTGLLPPDPLLTVIPDPPSSPER